MKIQMALIAVLAGIPIAQAADVEAGKATVNAVCAACHGGNGVSVSASIPNLAGQKVGYLTNQLQAFKAGERKNDLMNAIASQLDDQDIENVATFFASLPGAAVSSTNSEFLPNIAKSRVSFPADYRTRFTRYLTMNFPDDKENPVKDSDGFFAPDKLVGYAVMERQAGWGAEIPGMLRNDDWNYAPFTTDKVHRSGFNQAVCLACHKPLPRDSHLFTMKELREGAHAN